MGSTRWTWMLLHSLEVSSAGQVLCLSNPEPLATFKCLIMNGKSCARSVETIFDFSFSSLRALQKSVSEESCTHSLY